MTDLNIITINVWSGLDYQGIFRMGTYEPADRRRARFRALVHQLQELDPDLVFIQEANPLPRYARWLARAIGLRAFHQVVNAGIRIGPVGFPVNLREGLVILARPELRPRRHAAWKLSGGPGLHGDWLALHWSETVFALVVALEWAGRRVFAVNVHLTWSLPRTPGLDVLMEHLPPAARTPAIRRLAQAWSEQRDQRRARELRVLLDRLNRLPASAGLVIAGDFNVEPEAPEMRAFLAAGPFRDAVPEPAPGQDRAATWDPQQNENIRYAARWTDARGRPRRGQSLLSILAAAWPRRIDYILLGRFLATAELVQCQLAFFQKTHDVHPSDHFGVRAHLRVPPAPSGQST